MPWTIHLFEDRQAALAAGRALGLNAPPVGAMWPVTRDIDEWLTHFSDAVAPRYLREHRHVRPPLAVKLPDGCEFVIDTLAWTKEQGYHGDGWGCTGEPPAITLTPSINIVGFYHGWIQNGVITDDCEGRQFPAAVGCPEASP